MKTKISMIKNVSEDEEKIREAAECIKNGGTVVFPTETVYGLGADALNEEAVEKYLRPKEDRKIIHS